MTGLGDSYLGAFAIFLKATNPQIAFLAAVPQLLGSWCQFIAVWWLNRLKERKALILAGVLGQALTWLLILAAPFLFPSSAVWWLIAGVTLYFMLGNFVVPPWNSLMGDLVDPRQRGRYFGRRNRAMSVATFGALIVGGLILHEAQGQGKVAAGFVVIFAIALVARLVSAYYLSRMIEPSYQSRAEDRFSLWQFLRDGRRTNFGRFVAYIALVHFAVQVSAPFIVPYLLRDLHVTYLQFMAATAATVVAQVLTLPWWGRFCDRFGNKRVLSLTGLLLPVIPVFWLCTTNLYAIVAIQFFAGASWAGFSLAMGNFIFDTVSPPKRPQCVAVYNSANAVGILLGAGLGGCLIPWLPREFAIAGVHVALVSNLQLLFALSAVLRLVVALKFLPVIREVRDVSPLVAKNLTVKLAVRLLLGVRIVGRVGRAMAVWVFVLGGPAKRD